MTVQDDERERELVRLFNLNWDPAHQRSGVDATLDVIVDGKPHRIEVEVKSTTGHTVSTARDVGMEHVDRWRTKLFVIGFYSKEARRPELKRSLCLTPGDMAPWIDEIAAKILVDHRIAQRVRKVLGLQDLWDVCGQREIYALADARAVLRQQWTAQQYIDAADVIDSTGARAYSPAAMLEVLRLRAGYISERGATLNNPHITKRHLDRFVDTNREVKSDWASRVRLIAADWLRSAD